VSSNPRAVDLWACGTLEAAFRRWDRIPAPWSTGTTKAERRHRVDAAPALLTGRPTVADIDPLVLTATQPWVLAQHVEYYLTGAWEQNGITSADPHRIANRYPLVQHLGDAWILHGGHHRALAAIITGRPLRARVLRHTDDDVTAVLPRLLVGDHWPFEHIAATDPVTAVELLRAGHTVLMPTIAAATDAMHHAGLPADLIADRVAVATGAAH